MNNASGARALHRSALAQRAKSDPEIEYRMREADERGVSGMLVIMVVALYAWLFWWIDHREDQLRDQATKATQKAIRPR